jgi:hypothetical protein
MLVKVKVVELGKPACTVSERELAARAKSEAEPTVIAIVADWGDPPPVPVTVTEYGPTGVLLLADIVTMAVAEPPESNATGFALNDAEIPG